MEIFALNRVEPNQQGSSDVKELSSFQRPVHASREFHCAYSRIYLFVPATNHRPLYNRNITNISHTTPSSSSALEFQCFPGKFGPRGAEGKLNMSLNMYQHWVCGLNGSITRAANIILHT